MAAPDPSPIAVAPMAVSFADVPGWHQDDHLAAFTALLEGAAAVLAHPATTPALAAVYRAAIGEGPLITGRNAARGFFETRFRAVRLDHGGARGLLTGYYEPVLDGARAPTDTFAVPLYRRPPDLVNVVAESERGARAGAGPTHLRRRTDGTTEPYATRAEIDRGGLAGQGLELVYLACPIDAFMLHIQGSGAVRLPDGHLMRVTYDGKNGHPYTSVGRTMIERGVMAAEALTWQAMVDWLKADPDRARPFLWENRSYVFFRALDADGPIGVLGSPLMPGRSLAVDTGYHALGTPIYVVAPEMTHVTPTGFRRLMIAHDVGSAIRGPERGDVYFGTGDPALALAGITKHQGAFVVLSPREPAD